MPQYGTIDFDYAGRLATCPPDDDGPVFMINFMNYRERASYADGTDGGRSGRDADDAYAPIDVLTDIGAVVAFIGDVVDGTHGDGTHGDAATGDGTARNGGWHRLGIVRYPSRRAFIAMQSRPDFQELHTHKEAGMDHTIVVGVAASSVVAALAAGDGSRGASRVVFDLVRHAGGAAAPSPGQAIGPVEGTILGDGRTWTEVRITWLDDGDELPPCDDVIDRERVLVRPTIDRLPLLLAEAAGGPPAASAER